MWKKGQKCYFPFLLEERELDRACLKRSEVSRSDHTQAETESAGEKAEESE